MSCPSYIETKPVPVCVEELTIGTISALNTAVKVYVTKPNGNRYVHEVTTDGSGNVTIDCTIPSEAYYNEFDGLYLVSVGDNLNDLYNVAVGAESNTVIGVKFNNYYSNSVTSFTLEAV